MKKTDVYIVVDTPKKAKKSKKVLHMFGQEAHPNIERPFRNNYLYFDSEGFYDTAIYKNGVYTENKTEISIKELRNILAKEHLKAGDVVALGYGESVEYIGVFKSFNNGHFQVDRYMSLNSGSGILMNDSGYIKNFIRYATEEEKALLEPKKELEVGKWYKTKKSLFNHQDGYDSYGFFNKQWKSGDWRTYLDDFAFVTPIEANIQEVEQALIEEAKRRYKVGDKLSLFDGYYYGDGNNIYGGNFDCNSFDLEDAYLCVKTTNGWYHRIFQDGKWATVIEQDKLSNLKEAFNNGYCVEFYDVKTDTWKRHENPCWNPDLQWRIMVNNGHLVVSDVYLLNQIKDLKKSIEEIKSNIIQ